MAEPASDAWSSGEVIAEKYVLERALAKGGMGVVWAAKNRLTERRVAIKFVLPELAANPEAIQRFFREARASARIDHPSIVDVLDVGTLPNGVPFMVMEYLEGRSLEEVVERRPLTCPQAASIVIEVARALEAAHAAGIVHRDLKPANVFVARRGAQLVPKILDFGISKMTSANAGDPKMTRTGAVMGSPSYMSPEQARGRNDLDGRTDVWALGVILYEAVTGRLPFVGENYNQIMMSITLDEPRPLEGVDDDYRAIVDACMRKDRDARPQTMGALAEMLEAYLARFAEAEIAPIDVGGNEPGKTTIGAHPRALVAREALGATVAGAVTAIEAPKKSPWPFASIVAAVLVVVGATTAFALAHRARSSDRSAAAVAATATASSIPSAMRTVPTTTSAPTTTSVPATTSIVSKPAIVAPAKSSAAPVGTNKKSPPKKAPIVAPKKTKKDGPAAVGDGPGF